MKRTLQTLIALIALQASAQVKVGDNPSVIGASSMLEIESTNKGLVLPRVANTAVIASPVNGMMVYDLSAACTKVYENGAWSACLSSSPQATIVANCTGFEGAFVAGMALTGASYKVTVTNNSFSSTSAIALTAADLVLSGVLGLTVGTPTPTSMTVAAGASQVISYPVTGTPSATGTLTGAWTKISLSCSASKTVGTLASVVSANYCTGAAMNGNYVRNVALGAANTFTVTLTNTSGYAVNGFAAPAVGNLGLVWSGTGTVNVASVSPNTTFNLAAGGSQTITYTLGGTPTSTGTLTANWSYQGLTCSKTAEVTNGMATFVLPQSKALIAIFDGTPITDVAAVIDNTANQITFSVPYTSGSGTYAAYTGDVVAGAAGQGGDTNGFSISYPAGTFSAAGNFAVTVTVDGDGTYNVKKQLFGGQQTIVTIPFAVNGVVKGNLIIFAIGGIPDRRFGDGAHDFVYLPIVAEDGRKWLNNNLGAHYAKVGHASFNPTQQATGTNDFRAIGSLYQWGRESDGHELVTFTSATSGTPVNGSTTTLSSGNSPGHSMFIRTSTSALDWRSPQSNGLWQGVDGINNPCPIGYRLPTEAEWNTLRLNASHPYTNPAASASSLLKLIYNADRGSDGTIDYTYSNYWSSTTTTSSGFLASRIFTASTGAVGTVRRIYGSPVRCICDTP